MRWSESGEKKRNRGPKWEKLSDRGTGVCTGGKIILIFQGKRGNKTKEKDGNNCPSMRSLGAAGASTRGGIN